MGHQAFDKLVAALLLDEKYSLLLQRNHDKRRLPNTTQKPTQREVNYGEASRDRDKPNRFRKARRHWKDNGRKPASGIGGLSSARYIMALSQRVHIASMG
jgi:hypothetical protein